MTSENLWSLRELPKKLIVLGGGPIGTEMSQTFQRLGSQVTQVEMEERILNREDADIAEVVIKRLKFYYMKISNAVLKKDKSQFHGVAYKLYCV